MFKRDWTTFNTLENLFHTSSENCEENAYGHNLESAIILHEVCVAHFILQEVGEEPEMSIMLGLAARLTGCIQLDS